MRELILYCIIGGSCVLLDLLCYSTLISLNVHHQLANAVGYSFGTILSFILNRSLTFQVKDKTIQRLAVFISVAITGYLASTSLLYLLVDIFKIAAVQSKILTLPVVVALQFSLNKFITFKK